VAEIGYVSAERRAELYAGADVVVMPYIDLPAQSGVLQDAYASGRPVIATDVGALGSAIKADGTGWVVNPHDRAALVSILRAVVGQPDERRKRARTAQTVASARTPERIAAQLVGIYERALGRSGRTGDSTG
jgi:glycosyltransferase involved in cell wall biosynthesis